MWEPTFGIDTYLFIQLLAECENLSRIPWILGQKQYYDTVYPDPGGKEASYLSHFASIRNSQILPLQIWEITFLDKTYPIWQKIAGGITYVANSIMKNIRIFILGTYKSKFLKNFHI